MAKLATAGTMVTGGKPAKDHRHFFTRGMARWGAAAWAVVVSLVSVTTYAAGSPQAPGFGGFGGFGAGSLGNIGSGMGGGLGGFGGPGPTANADQPGVRHGDWLLVPSFLARQFYTDNLTLAPDSGANRDGLRKDDAFITELSPGISVRHDGRSQFMLNYRMQNLIYAGTDVNPRINHQLQMTSNVELLDDSLFVNATSNVGQFNSLGSGVLALDQTSAGRGRSQAFQTFRISPYWLPHFAGYAEGIVLASYSNVGGGSGSSNVDANIFEQYADLRSGKEFEAVGWRMNFYNQDNQRNGNSNSGAGNNSDILSRNYNGELSYRILESVRPFVQIGNFENEISGDDPNAKAIGSGGYWTVGLYWRPGRKLALQGGYGDNNSFASLSWAPSERTQLQVTYRDADVGTFSGIGTGMSGSGGLLGGGGAGAGMSSLTGTASASGYRGGVSGVGDTVGSSGAKRYSTGTGVNGAGTPFSGAGGVGQLGGFYSGQTWNASLTHRTRRTTWYAAYTVQTTSIQQVLVNQPVFGGGFGGNGVLSVPIDQPCLTNDPITRKRAQVGVQAMTARTSLSVSGYQEDRSSRTCGNQDVLGVNATWGWRFIARTSSFLSFAWQSINSNVETQTSGDSDIVFVSVGMSRSFSPDVEGFLEFRHTDQNAKRDENQYEENRVNASVFMRF